METVEARRTNAGRDRCACPGAHASTALLLLSCGQEPLRSVPVLDASADAVDASKSEGEMVTMVLPHVDAQVDARYRVLRLRQHLLLPSVLWGWSGEWL